jgi:hypothetical protein
VIDFGYRAVHEMTVQAKAIINGYYSSAPKFSYFNGCSLGGRQGITEAQRYPADYDGIVAGAVAWGGMDRYVGVVMNNSSMQRTSVRTYRPRSIRRSTRRCCRRATASTVSRTAFSRIRLHAGSIRKCCSARLAKIRVVSDRGTGPDRDDDSTPGRKIRRPARS